MLHIVYDLFHILLLPLQTSGSMEYTYVWKHTHFSEVHFT